MSYAATGALQAAVFGALQANALVQSLSAGHIYDALPAGSLPALYVAIGDETVKDASDGTHGGARHDFVVSVVSETAGFQTAKELAAAISDALSGVEATLTRGHLVGIWFLKARAKRESGGTRRIDITFRARVEDS